MSLTSIESEKQLGCVMHFSGMAQSAQTVKTITANGGVTQVLPFAGAGIGMFDGTGDYLTVGSVSDFNFLHQVGTTGKWSIAFWYQWNNRTVSSYILNTSYSSTFHGLGVMFDASRHVIVSINRGVTSQSVIDGTTTGTVPNDANWHYIVITYDQSLASSNANVYCDGSLLAGTLSKSAYTPSTSDATYIMNIGRSTGGTYPLNGKLSELIIYDGIVIDGTKVIRNQLQVTSNTKLLLHFQANGTTFVDSSPTPKTITANGNATQLCSPCGSGVAKFDGYDDRLTIASSSDFAFGTGDFTIRTVFYITAIETGHLQWILDMRTADTDVAIELILHEIGVITVRINGYVVITSSSLLSINTWYTVTIVRSSGILRLYIDNTQTGNDYSDSNNYAARPITVGCRYASALVGINGYISELEISNGIARPIIVPTTPFKPDSYTKLLLHMDGTGQAFYDASNPPGDNGFPILPDGVSVTPAGTWTSIKAKDGRNYLTFNGSTNYISLGDLEAWTLGSYNFTLVLWAKFNTVNAIHTLFHLFAATNSGLELYSNASAKLCLKISDTSTAGNMVNTTGSATLVASTWYHIAVVRTGSTFVVYINLVSDSTGSSSATIINPTAIAIGSRPAGTPDQYHTGCIKDLQIFKGRALSPEQIAQIMAETYIS